MSTVRALSGLYGWWLLLAGAAAPAVAQAQQTVAAQLPSLAQMTLEELLNVDVTVPLRRPERVADVPVPIAVLTAEDIRRSGAVNLPDALRFAPGLFVARFSNTASVVTSRGFASNAANKMLVMIDGRSVYSPLFSGVFWEQQDVLLPDVERIEVVRGPGATLWGSNAVNGIINVVSKPASQTQGALVSITGGVEERVSTSLRYGGRAGAGHYRVYGRYFDRDDARLSTGSDAQDGHRLGQGGFRFDLGGGRHDFTLQGDVYHTQAGLLGRPDLEGGGGNVLARWARQLSAGSRLQVQAYYDRTFRSVPSQFEEWRDTIDVDLQHFFTPARRHSLGWGAAYRNSRDDTTPTVLLFFEPEDRSTDLVSAFVQDELQLQPDLVLTGGVKVEHNDYTGLEWQPTGRIRWTAAPQHVVWAGVSRAVRLPTRLDTDVRVLGLSNRVVIAGNPDFKSEEAVVVEGGYRVSPRTDVSLDIAAFYNRYDNLRSQERPSVPGQPLTVDNLLRAKSSGVELVGKLQPRPWAGLIGSYTFLDIDFALDPASRDPRGGVIEAVDPAHQLVVQTRFNLPRGVELDAAVRWTSELPGAVKVPSRVGAPVTPAYTEATVRGGWRVNPSLDLSIVGRDLLHDSHFEFIAPTSGLLTRLQRAVYGRATIAF